MNMVMSASSAEEQREIGEALLALSPPRSHLKEPPQPRGPSMPMPSLLLELESSQASQAQQGQAGDIPTNAVTDI